MRLVIWDAIAPIMTSLTHRDAFAIMVVADGKAPYRHQTISNQHAVPSVTTYCANSHGAFNAEYKSVTTIKPTILGRSREVGNTLVPLLLVGLSSHTENTLWLIVWYQCRITYALVMSHSWYQRTASAGRCGSVSISHNTSLYSLELTKILNSREYFVLNHFEETSHMICRFF